MRANLRLRLRLRFDLAVVVACALLGLYVWRADGWGFYSALIAALLVFVALAAIAGYGMMPHRVFRGESKLREEYRLTFSARGIHFQMAHIDSQLQWSMYSSALFNQELILLYYGTNGFTLIPRRAFAGIEEEREFEDLVKASVGKIILKRGEKR